MSRRPSPALLLYAIEAPLVPACTALVGAVARSPLAAVALCLPQVAAAFPRATLIHALRDGRDVVCSLLERGWLGAERRDADDTGAVYGVHPRFWVEEGREEEFRRATDARRCAWAWRRYVSAVKESGVPVTEVRYERLASDRAATAEDLARVLGVPAAAMTHALGAAHDASVGRWRRDLTPDQVADVEAEAADVLAAL